jgi:tetratricopeptide (TPR) repeat protein
MAQKSFKYKAFISYSHQDKKWGDWLHKALETYRVPKGLIGKQTEAGVVPKRLFPIFRDREELPTSHELGKVIDQALRDSSHLLIICSPRSAKSLWVNEEIKQFKRLDKSDNILCLIVDGEPNATDKPGLEEEECFPEAAKYEIGEDGELKTIRTEPIAADAREGRDGKRNALLKVVAGLLAVGFDDLKQRDLARKQKRMAIVSGASMALVAIMGGLTFWALDQQREAERQRSEAIMAQEAELELRKIAQAQRFKAESELGKAMSLSDFMQEIFTALEPREMKGVDERDKDLMKLVLQRASNKISNLDDLPEAQADIRDILGTTYTTLGFHEESLPHFEAALNIRLKLLEPGDSDLATSYLKLGMAHHRLNEYEKGISCMEKALAIRIDSFGAENLGVAECYLNLGNSVIERGDHDKARKYLDNALAIRLKYLGNDHTETGRVYNSIGVTLAKKKEYTQALEFYEKSLAIFLQSLGSDSPSLAMSYNNIGSANDGLGNSAKALEFFEKSIATNLRAYGPGHHSLIVGYSNIGLIHAKHRDYANAIQSHSKALAIKLKTLAPENPSIGSSYFKIGQVYASSLDYEKAIENYHKAVETWKLAFGEEHPNIADAYYSLASAYGNSGRDANLYLEKALVIRLKVLGEDHEDVGSIYLSLGFSYDQKGKYGKAIEYFDKALLVFSSKPSKLPHLYYYMGECFYKMGEDAKGMEYLEKAVSLSLEEFGESHYLTKSLKLSILLSKSDNGARLGVRLKEAKEGLTIAAISKKSAAEKAGLKSGDVIAKLNGKPVSTIEEFLPTVVKHKPGEEVQLNFLREGKAKTLTVKLSKKVGNLPPRP